MLTDTLDQLENIRHRTTANAQMLTSTITAMLERLQGTWESLEPKYQRLQEWTNIYWTTGWIAAMLIIWVLLFMSMSYCFFLCESNIKAGIVIFIAILIICIGSICITLYGLLTLAIGGNSEVFLCRPLYHTRNIVTNNGIQVEYDMLGKLFDKPGYIYENEPQMGIIGELLRPAGVNRPIVNVSLANALRFVVSSF